MKSKAKKEISDLVLLTRREVGEIFRISESTVIRWEKAGILKRVKVPGMRKALYDKRDIEKLINEWKGGKHRGSE
jgi:predicted site-specific integrase-resolvase